MDMRISVIGAGYLGATHAACLAELGFEVIGVDLDPERIEQLRAGVIPFSEPGLQEIHERHVASGRLTFTTDIAEAAAHADVHFICVGTPQSKTGPEADVTAVHATARALARHLTRDALIVGKSTVPVGTAAALAAEVRDLVPEGRTVSVAWNPEFLREGHAVKDTLEPDRLVFGVSSPEAELTLRRVYDAPIAAGVPVHVTDLATSELAKVAANAFLATKISWINAMAEVSDRAGADVVSLADIIGGDARIGRRFLDAGIGFGGGCLPKDIRAFGARAGELGVSAVADLLGEVDAINLRARRRTVELVGQLCGRPADRLAGVRVTVLGAAFKPLSDDVRDSPALDIAAQLHAAGASVRVHDPEAVDNAAAEHPALHFLTDVEAALTDAEVVLHLTDWPQYAALDPAAVGRLVARRCIVDGRNKLDRERWQLADWTFVGVGRGTVVAPRLPDQRRTGSSSVSGEGDPRNLVEWT